MRVLWFANSPSLAKEKLNQVTVGGGWIESIQEQMEKRPDISLAISFYAWKKTESFVYNKTEYFPLQVSNPKSRFKRYITRMQHRIEDEETELKKFLDVIAKFKPDIIHIFGTEFPFGLIAGKSAVPVLIWIQGNITVYNEKRFSGITHEEVKKYSSLKNKIRGFGLYHSSAKMKKIAIREQKIFEQCQYFLGRTEWDRRITKILAPQAKYFHCEELLRSHFYNSCFVPTFSKGREFRLVSVLNADIYKGFETIFQTMRLLKKHYSGFKIQWGIVGIDGSEEVVKIVERRMKINAGELNITFNGKLKSDALVSRLGQSDLFVHPSHIENSPNSLCEAMIYGMPIICTNVGGVSSLIENNKEGVLLQDGDPFALAGAIIEVNENYDVYLNYGIEARKRAIIRHNPNATVENLINIYSTIKNEHS